MNATAPVTVGISTCPNDTFAFAALMEKRVEGPDLCFVLDDVQALNERVMRGDLQVAKASFHAALHVARHYRVLPVGAALGYGVGPLMLSRDHADRPPGAGDRVLCPGKWTTATLLYRLFCPDGPEPRQVVFSEIIPALRSGAADFGVVIHEGRFTYQEQGLHCALDLGARWEQETLAPLPLGGILARRDLGEGRLEQVTRAIRASLQFAKKEPERVLPKMAEYAQEMSEEVLWEHVRLYVNDSTEDLGEEGRRALSVLAGKAREVGLGSGDELSVFGPGSS